MIIYGAGMSGLLAATMLARHSPIIHEAASELPNNHAALLRFRSDAVSKATGIPFKKVWVQKAVMNERDELHNYATITDQNCYSLKVSGAVRGRSIGNLSAGERYIAPEDFISQLARGKDIMYNKPLDKFSICDVKKGTPTISTIPMIALMKIVGWSDIPAFKYQEIATITAEVVDPKIEVYQTIYYPYSKIPAYRASITGNKIIVEFIYDPRFSFESCSNEDLMLSLRTYLMHFIGSEMAAVAVLSNVKYKHQKYGKLVNSTGRSGKEFILAMTDLHGIYSLGRFATWRQILMDDVVQDINIIDAMISQRDSYSRRLRII